VNLLIDLGNFNQEKYRALGVRGRRHCLVQGEQLRPSSITAEHAELAGALPPHHTDPFDRMLVAQAKIEGLVLLTQDRKLLSYGVPVLGLG
jgi:PIN domain nuclease of toxin-antitoxin system